MATARTDPINYLNVNIPSASVKHSKTPCHLHGSRVRGSSWTGFENAIAKTTPQMIVINPQGVVVYDGAIDNRPTPDLKDISGAMNYVSVALGQSLSGKPVETAATRPYGCSVKYPGTWF
jgi:hypothetical protein